MSDRQETYVYESPDGGDTVYRRRIGSTPQDRTLYATSMKKREWDRRQARQNLWHDILKASESDSALREMMDKIEVYFNLKSH